MKIRNFAIVHVLLFLTVAMLSENPWPFLMLTVAQLVYVPIALRLIWIKFDWFAKRYWYFAIPAYTAVALLQITPASKWDILLAAVYLLFTIVIALYGLSRFFNRGFSNIEEFSIDAGLIYVALGGAWFFAYITGINTGFSPLITWLTGIHFHYSAFLLPIFMGFAGRLYKPRLYGAVCSIILASPMIVAIGITFSRWIELLSVILYIIGLGGLIFIAWKTPFTNTLQKWMVRMSFGALGVTIIFSLLYALGNGFGLTAVDIDFMLRFHGVLNCLVFALCGIVGWSLSTPTTSFDGPTFPVSHIRGKWMIGEQILDNKVDTNHSGLVDDMDVYQCVTISPGIIHFYENTTDYRLFTTVKWRTWFKPVAFLYALISRQTQQINLPVHNRQVEMTGDVLALRDGVDGRKNVRAWVRKIDKNTAFVALYAEHTHAGRTYMNIALPLPFSTMTGILELHQVGNELQLTSKKISSPNSDAGIYLSWKANHLFKLPIEENFMVREMADGTLLARHSMWLFSLPFLTIEYLIHHKERPA
ncbi:YndJ family protein [Sporosarcina sp. FSL K6-3457]|uniref:YndJ family protein n=1 Tax=Sporosarcina sp. FSL K6-3457 TaxID=2978204 RepID=UPI0030F8E546